MADEHFTVVSVLDPAIDSERMTVAEMVAYMETRDINKIRPFYKPGEQPVEYRCREVPHTLWESYVMQPESDAERFRRAFQAGVMSVKNARNTDGTRVDKLESLPRGNGDVIANESMSRFSAASRAEIGQVVFQRSFLAPETVRTYQLPPTVRACLVERAFLPAASSPSSPAPDSEAASSGTTPAASSTTGSMPASSAETSAALTAATATESGTQAA